VNKKEMMELLTMIENAYPRFYPDDDYKAKQKADLWASYMKDWDYERTKRNIREHILNVQFEPKISEVKAPKKKKRLSVDEQLRRGGVNI